jgi:hypothetical protein
MNTKSSAYPGWLFSAAMAAVCSCLGLTSVTAADIVDEAKAQGKTPADFPADDYDYYRDMDMRPDGTADASGTSSTSSKVRPSRPNFSSYESSCPSKGPE